MPYAASPDDGRRLCQSNYDSPYCPSQPHFDPVLVTSVVPLGSLDLIRPPYRHSGALSIDSVVSGHTKKKLLFPVQRVSVIKASWEAAFFKIFLYAFWFVRKILSIFFFFPICTFFNHQKQKFFLVWPHFANLWWIYFLSPTNFQVYII